MTIDETPEVTEDQAAEALHQLSLIEEPEMPAEPEQPAAEVKADETEIAGTATEGVDEAVLPPAAEDDIESLRTRVTGLETQVKEDETRHEARMRALQGRNAESEKILRDRMLRKSTASDVALRILKAGRTEAGVPEADVDRAIQGLEGTMHPDSASYVAPDTRAASQEDQTIILNNFLNEQGMTDEESQAFGNWISNEAPKAMSQNEQDVARESVGGFLRLAHTRWQEGKRQKQASTENAVGAVRSVQRTQKAAARAASATPTAPRKQPGTPRTQPQKELTKDDVSRLLVESVEQYR